MAYEYPAMLSAAVYDRNTRVINQPEINTWYVGNKKVVVENNFDDSLESSTDGFYQVRGIGENIEAWATVLFSNPDKFGMYANKSTFVQDRTYRDNKAYTCTVNAVCTPYADNDTQRFLIGFGAVMRN